MTQETRSTAPSRRVFIYGDHRFDDPGREYTAEQVRQHLVQYFPELAHAATEEKALPDGTVEITFRKQVARKGAGAETENRLSLLLAGLEAVPPYEDPLAELIAALGPEPLTLAAILDARETLQTHAGQVENLGGRTEQVVKRCLELPPSPTHGVPLGF
jgi:PRTRC genetic system protein C